jgi:membrane complex biogenesis BtpA family protein
MNGLAWKRSLIGMVHVGALPTSPRAKLSVREIVAQAVMETKTLRDAGFDAILIENMHDVPYVNGPHDAATVAAMTMVATAVRDAAGAMPVGIQILSRGEKEALAVAHASGLDFVRCENFVFAHVADEGLLADAAAGPLLRYRRRLGAERIQIYADIQKKHASHAITSDLGLSDLAHGAEFFGADGLIVTGMMTGQPADVSDVATARKATKLPILVGSGVTPDQLGALFAYADALIVGSWIKTGGVWSNAVDAGRAREMVRARG